MRVLIVPSFAMGVLTGDGVWENVKSFVRARPDDFFYVAMPTVYHDQLESVENCKYVFIDAGVDTNRFWVMSDLNRIVQLFNVATGDYRVEAVVCYQALIAMQLDVVLNGYRTDGIPIVVYHTMTHSYREMAAPELLPHLMMTRNVYWMAEMNREKEILLDLTEMYLGREYAEYCEGRTFVVYPAVDVEEVKALRVRKKGKKRVMYGGRLSKWKNIDWMIDRMIELYAAGNDVELVMTTQDVGDRTSKLEKLEKVETALTMTGADRKAFLNELSQAHVFLMASKEEGYNCAVREAMLLEAIPVLPLRSWAIDQFPMYPFMYSDKHECVGMMEYIVKHYPKALNQMIEWCDERCMWDVERVEESMKRMMSAIEERRWTFRHVKVKRALGLMPDKFTFDEFLVRYTKLGGNVGRAFHRSLNKGKLYASLLSEGAVDPCDSEEVRLVK